MTLQKAFNDAVVDDVSNRLWDKLKIHMFVDFFDVFGYLIYTPTYTNLINKIKGLE